MAAPWPLGQCATMSSFDAVLLPPCAMTYPHPWPPTAIRPTRKDIKPGDWLVLHDGWIVGPVVITYEEFDRHGTSVKCGTGVMQVDTIEQPDTSPDSPRLVLFAGPLEHALIYRQHIETTGEKLFDAERWKKYLDSSS